MAIEIILDTDVTCSLKAILTISATVNLSMPKQVLLGPSNPSPNVVESADLSVAGADA